MGGIGSPRCRYFGSFYILQAYIFQEWRPHTIERHAINFLRDMCIQILGVCCLFGWFRFKIKHEGPEEWENMWQKSRAIWKYIDRHYKNDFDWFVLGGDDIFLIVENLRKV